MYRGILKQCLLQVLSSGHGVQKSCQYKSVKVLNKFVKSGRGITFCQWRYIRTVACQVGNKVSAHNLIKISSFSTQGEAAAKAPAPETVNGVLSKYHTHWSSGSFHPESISQFSSALCSAVYSGLGWVPWLHNENHVIAFMQILMNGRTEELLTTPLYQHEHFKEIYDILIHSVDQIPGKDCPSVLLHLLYSGLQQTDSLVLQLLQRCHDAAHEFDVSQIRDMTHSLQSIGGRDFILIEKVMCRLDGILRQHPDSVKMEILDLCVSNPVLGAFMSQDLMERCVSAILYKVEQQYPNLDVATIGCCFRYARKMIFRADREKLNRIRDLGRGALEVLPDSVFSEMQSHHIAEIGHNAKRLGCYTGRMVDRIQKRSLDLLQDKSGHLRIRDITNLLFAFTRDTSPALKQKICQMLLHHLDDADVLTLSNVGDNLLELDVNDAEVIKLYQWKVLQNFNNISMFITRLVKVLRLLRERMEYDSDFNQQLSQMLLKLLDQRQGYDPTFVVLTAQFVLPNVRTVVPAILTDCLMNVIPRCSLWLMLMVLNGLEKMKGPWSRSLHNQVFDLRSKIQENVGDKIKNARSASELSQLVKGLHIKSQSRDFSLLDRMMTHYPQLTKTMNRYDYLRTIHVFRQFSHPYYFPEVFEDMITFAKNNYKQIGFDGVLDLANVLASAAYRPENVQEFTDFTTQALMDGLEEENYIGQLTLAHYLSIMQIFPDRVLGQIFTFDYLEEVDSIIEAEPDRRVFLKNLMMQLNRTMVLECPHLDIPWFHEAYCREMFHNSYSKDFQKNFLFVDEVESALQEILRGLKFLGKKVYSPYYHAIDFEVVLDKAGDPVASGAVKLLKPEERGYQRVALMLIANQQLCANSTRRRGQYLKEKRQLEILGYRVEEIARYDWNSMALSDWSAKVNYVHKKLFRGFKKEFSPGAPSSTSATKNTVFEEECQSNANSSSFHPVPMPHSVPVSMLE